MLRGFKHRIVGPLVIAWILLTISGIVVRVIVWNRLTRSIDASGEATQLGVSLDQLFTALQDAESSQRGYLLTTNEQYADAFKKAEGSLSVDFNQLAQALREDPSMQNDLLNLRGLTEVKMAEMRDNLKLRQDNKSINPTLNALKDGKDRESMDKIRKLMWQMRQRRQNIFTSAWENTRQNLELAQKTGVAIGFLGVGAGLFALYLVRVGYLQERAQRRLLEEKINVEKTMVQKSAFLANMSHEIRTPMNAILGFGELLEDETLTPKQAQYVRSIRDSGALLLQLINDVLDLSKLEAGKLELHPEPLDLRETCDFLQTMFGQQAAAKSIELRLQADSLPHALELDRLRLRQVLVNLVGNAIKFTPRGHVAVTAHWRQRENDRSRGTLLIEVEDSGIGISPEMQQEIFKPFIQSNPQRNLENQGTGLGLSIVQRLTQAMGGTITLQSAPGAGSIFRLSFPNVSVSARLPASALLEPAISVDFNDFAPATLLVADDNQKNRELMKGLFEGTHHRLRLAANGEEALASIAEMRPDLVMLDIRMPVMDGRVTLAEIRKRNGLELLPVLAVTASSQAEDEKDLRSRFSGYLRKPFSREALYRELAQFLPRRTAAKPEPPVASFVAAEPQPFAANGNGHRKALAAELRRLQQTRWPLLRETLAINETQAFAAELRRLAQTMHWNPLAVYADQLAVHAETYAVRELEQRLDEFPALVMALEQPAEAA